MFTEKSFLTTHLSVAHCVALLAASPPVTHCVCSVALLTAGSVSHCLCSIALEAAGSVTHYLCSVGCHCNAAGYFIDMPGPNGGEGGDYYCDANFVGGQWWVNKPYNILGPNTFKTSLPDGRCVNVWTLCQYINTSSVRSCIWMKKGGNFKLKKRVSVLTSRHERVKEPNNNWTE